MSIKNLNDLIEALKTRDLSKPIVLGPHCTIENPSVTVKTHIGFLKANSGNERFRPYMKRLYEIYKNADEIHG